MFHDVLTNFLWICGIVGGASAFVALFYKAFTLLTNWTDAQSHRVQTITIVLCYGLLFLIIAIVLAVLNPSHR